jgi:hypothetical protein
MGPAIGEVMSVCAAQGITPAGPVFSHHFRMVTSRGRSRVPIRRSGARSSTGRSPASGGQAVTAARTQCPSGS